MILRKSDEAMASVGTAMTMSEDNNLERQVNRHNMYTDNSYYVKTERKSNISIQKRYNNVMENKNSYLDSREKTQ